MRIFLLNLRSAIERKQRIVGQLNKLGLPFELFEAVYGKEVPDETAALYYDMEFYHNRPKFYTPGQVGCTLSHYFIYKKIVEEKIPVTFVLEDDMVLTDDLPEVLNAIEKQIKKDEVIMIYYQCFHTIELIKKDETTLYNQYKLYPTASLHGLTCTGAYCITYEVAKRFVDNLLPLTTLPDDWEKFFAKNCFDNMRMVYPFVINNAYLPSDITPYESQHKYFKGLFNLANRKKIFPFYQLLKWRRKRSYAKARICNITDKQKDYHR